MDTKKLDRWSELLLDTGKRNNLVNFSKQDKSCMHFAKFLGRKALKISTFDVCTFQKSLTANLHALPFQTKWDTHLCFFVENMVFDIDLCYTIIAPNGALG